MADGAQGLLAWASSQLRSSPCRPALAGSLARSPRPWPSVCCLLSAASLARSPSRAESRAPCPPCCVAASLRCLPAPCPWRAASRRWVVPRCRIVLPVLLVRVLSRGFAGPHLANHARRLPALFLSGRTQLSAGLFPLPLFALRLHCCCCCRYCSSPPRS